MTTSTITAPRVRAREVKDLISAFLLRTIAASDFMIDREGVFSFSYGLGRAERRVERRVEIRQTAPQVYRVDAGHIDPKTCEWTVDLTHSEVQADDLRTVIRELT